MNISPATLKEQSKEVKLQNVAATAVVFKLKPRNEPEPDVNQDKDAPNTLLQ